MKTLIAAMSLPRSLRMQTWLLKHSMQSGMERHLGDMNKQLRLKLEAEGFNLKAMESLWSSTSAATNNNFMTCINVHDL
ncbi:hypothetical protein HN51_044884 [Arachis hypogaea]